MGYLSVIICFSFAFHKLSVIDNLMGRQSDAEKSSLRRKNKKGQIVLFIFIIRIKQILLLAWTTIQMMVVFVSDVVKSMTFNELGE